MSSSAILMFLVFFIPNLTSAISWPWWAITSPLWVGIAFWAIVQGLWVILKDHIKE
jgi:succinate dehydrogenase hydrophobic anchor subunit